MITHFSERLGIFFCSGVLLAQSAFAGNDAERPYLRWTSGDSWVVCDWAPQILSTPAPGKSRFDPNVLVMSTKRFYRFEVLREMEFGGQACFEVDFGGFDFAKNVKSTSSESFRVCYDKEKCVLRVVANVREGLSLESDNRLANQAFVEGLGPFSYMDQSLLGRYAVGYMTDVPLFLPALDRSDFDWPKPPKSSARRTLQAPQGQTEIHKWISQVLRERKKDIGGNLHEYHLSGHYQDADNGTTGEDRIRTEYVFEFRPGEPWWHTCRAYELGKFVRYWQLVRIGTKDLPIEEPDRSKLPE